MTTIPLRRSPAVRVGLSVAVATGLYGVSFGALSVASGLDVWQTCVLSLVLFSGGSQFAFVGVVAGGGAGAAAAGAAALLGVRNAVYGMQIAALLRPRGWRRPLAAHVTIDESLATSTAQADPVEQRRAFWVTGVGVFVLWNLFTLVGALAGDALGDPRRWGLDGAAVAAFLGLLWPRLRGREAGAIAVACALATVLVVPVVPPGLPVIVAAVVAVGAGVLSARRAAPAAEGEGLEPDVEPDVEPGASGAERAASGVERAAPDSEPGGSSGSGASGGPCGPGASGGPSGAGASGGSSGSGAPGAERAASGVERAAPDSEPGGSSGSGASGGPCGPGASGGLSGPGAPGDEVRP